MGRLQEQAEALVDRLSRVMAEHDSISRAQSPEEVVTALYDGVRRHLCPQVAAVFLRDGNSLRYVPPPSSTSGGASVDHLLSQASESVLECLQTHSLVRSVDKDSQTRFAVPLLTQDTVSGALEVTVSDTGQWGPVEELGLHVLAKCAAVSLHHLYTLLQLSTERERLEILIGSSADAIITTDNRGLITLFSPGAEEIFGYRAEEVLGSPVTQYYYRGRREAEKVMEQLRVHGKLQNHETWFRSKAGRGVPASLSCSLLYDTHGSVTGTLGVLKDITPQKEMEEKLNYTIERLQEANEQLEVLAITDPLSGLFNHRYFYRELDEEVERSIRTRRPLSVLMIDIDKFKDFNDTYGHQIGDQLIEEIGRVVLKNIRRVDTGCRYGGEEFTVILPETRDGQACIVADRIRLGFSRSPIFSDLKIRQTTLSIGVAMFDPKLGRVSPAEIVRLADQTMYEVKRKGGDAVELAATRPDDEATDVLG